MNDSQLTLFIILLAIPAVLAYVDYRKKQWYQKNGISATGTVLKLVYDQDDDESPSYPIIHFQTKQHGWIAARYDVGSNRAAYRVNQSVRLLYDPRNPMKFIIGVEPFGVSDWWPYALVVVMLCVGFYVSLADSLPF